MATARQSCARDTRNSPSPSPIIGDENSRAVSGVMPRASTQYGRGVARRREKHDTERDVDHAERGKRRARKAGGCIHGNAAPAGAAGKSLRWPAHSPYANTTSIRNPPPK